MSRAGKAPLTPTLHKQTLTFAGTVLAQLPMISEEKQQYYIGHPKSLSERLRVAFADDVAKPIEAPMITAPKSPVLRTEFKWAATLYEKLWGKIPDFSGLVVPQASDDRECLVVPVMREMTEWTSGKPKEGLYQARKKLFPCWKWTDDLLDAAIPVEKDERRFDNESYVVLMFDSEQPDEDLMGKPAQFIADTNIKTSTDTEYALFSALYFLKHGIHPDRSTWTLNAGSRCRDGRVPCGGWLGGRSGVNWYDAADSNPSLGVRRVAV